MKKSKKRQLKAHGSSRIAHQASIDAKAGVRILHTASLCLVRPLPLRFFCSEVYVIPIVHYITTRYA